MTTQELINAVEYGPDTSARLAALNALQKIPSLDPLFKKAMECIGRAAGDANPNYQVRQQAQRIMENQMKGLTGSRAVTC